MTEKDAAGGIVLAEDAASKTAFRRLFLEY